MLPAVNHPVWTEIVIGKKAMQTGKATVNLLIQSSRISYGRNPSPENLSQVVAKLHSFFTRYESTFTTEIAQISQ
jgi:hypothetical protein